MVKFLSALSIFCLLFLSTGPLMAAPSQPQVAVLVDASGSETIASVSDPARQQDFKPLSGPFSAGYTRKVHWLRFTLVPLAPDEHNEILEIHPSYLKDLRLYEAVDHGSGRFRVRYTGNSLPFSSREFAYRGFAFRIAFADARPRTFYLRLQTTSSSIVSLRQWSATEFAAANLKEYGLLGLFYGMLVAIVIVNFMHWVWTREALFKLYVLYVSMLVLMFLGSNGLIMQFVLPLQPYWVDKWIGVTLFLAVTLSAPFLSRILDTGPASRRWAWVYRLQFWVPVFLLPAPFLGYYPEAATIAMVLASFTLSVGLCRGFGMLMKRRTPSATFILIAHAIGLFGNLSVTLTLLGLLPGDFWLIYGIQVGILLEALAFSMAVSVRFGETEVERRRAQERAGIAEQRAESERLARTEQGRFMAMLTHELKTPMSVIRVALATAGIQSKSMLHAEHAIEDMNNVIDRCIQADHIEQRALHLRKEPVDVVAFVQDLLQASSRLGINVHAGDLPLLATDRQYFGIAIANLLDNAVKYAAQDSMVDVFVRLQEEETRPGIEIIVQNLPGTAGIPASDQVFKKYYRSAGAHAKTGSGLGLYLVHSMSEFLGARVRYLPSDTLVRFALWLPL